VTHQQTLSGDTGLVLPEFGAPPQDPHALLREWLDSAVARGVREPFAAVLATADASGRVSGRVLLVKELDARGLLFTSSRESRKGRELAASPWASLTFYWRETLQQLTAGGPVEVLAEQQSDDLFSRRPLPAQAATRVSRQSRELQDETALRHEAQAVVSAEDASPRPRDWTGYRLVPHEIEFWHGSPDRLHRRLRYERRTESATWQHQRLQP
jgi:pyridoxamine 5'-phosphate oxidase